MDVGAGKAGFLEKLILARKTLNKRIDNLYALNLTPNLLNNSEVKEINCDLDSLVNNPYQLIRNQTAPEVAPESFDFIMSQHGPFHHSPVPGYTLLQMLKLLNTNGKLLIVGRTLEEKSTLFLEKNFPLDKSDFYQKRKEDYGTVLEILMSSKLITVKYTQLGESRLIIITKN